jgi:hypothetical protein
MKTKEITKQEEKTLVEQMREIRDKVNLDIKDLTAAELKAYFDKQETLHPKGLWKKD